MPAKATAAGTASTKEERERLIHAKIVAAIASGEDSKNVGLLEAMQGFTKLYQALEHVVDLNEKTQVNTALEPHTGIMKQLKAKLAEKNSGVAKTGTSANSAALTEFGNAVTAFFRTGIFASMPIEQMVSEKTQFESSSPEIPDPMKDAMYKYAISVMGDLIQEKKAAEPPKTNPVGRGGSGGKNPPKVKFDFTFTESSTEIAKLLPGLPDPTGNLNGVKTPPSGFTESAVSPFKSGGFGPYPIPISQIQSDSNIKWFVNEIKSGATFENSISDDEHIAFIRKIIDIIHQYVSSNENKQADKYTGVAWAVQMNIGSIPADNSESKYLGSLFYRNSQAAGLSAASHEYYRNFLL